MRITPAILFVSVLAFCIQARADTFYDDTHVAHFVKVLKTSSYELQKKEAARILGHLSDPRTLQPMVEAVQQDGSPAVRASVAEALGRLGMPEALPVLVQVGQSDQSSEVRAAANKARDRIEAKMNLKKDALKKLDLNN